MSQAVHARHLHVGLHGEHPIAPREDEGIGEVRQGVGENQQPGREDAGHAEGEGDGAEGGPSVGPEI